MLNPKSRILSALINDVCPQKCTHYLARCPQCDDTQGPRKDGHLVAWQAKVDTLLDDFDRIKSKLGNKYQVALNGRSIEVTDTQHDLVVTIECYSDRYLVDAWDPLNHQIGGMHRYERFDSALRRASILINDPDLKHDCWQLTKQNAECLKYRGKRTRRMRRET